MGGHDMTPSEQSKWEEAVMNERVAKRLDEALAGPFGKAAIGMLLTILIGLGSYQLAEVQTHSQSLSTLSQRVADLQRQIDDKYGELRERVELHYVDVEHKSDIIAKALIDMSLTLSTQNAELTGIRQQLDDAKAQEKIDIERTNIERHSSEPVPSRATAPSVPLLGPLIDAISGGHKKHRSRQ